MADGLIEMMLQGTDFDVLTANSHDVLQGKTFIGKDGIQKNGEIVNRESPTVLLGLNGNVSLPSGKYSGGKVLQSIPTMGEMRIMPGNETITVPTKDMYMTGDIIVEFLNNLTPENIKEGEYVGGVGPGTFKGYVVTSPNVFYYRGTFAPGQSLEDYPRYDNTRKLSRTDTDRDIQFYASAGGSINSFTVFSLPIDVTALNKVKFQIVNRGLSSTDEQNSVIAILSRNKFTNENNLTSSETVAKKIFDFGKKYNNIITNFEMDISSISRTVYLYMILNVNLKDYLDLRIVEFE